MMPLVFANAGEETVVRRIGGSPEVRQHLADLGFNVGTGVTVVSAMGGNVIVKVKESRVAISREMAQKIMV
ncbi:MAG: ferrous iron transport protein A [Oscillospiraceae bacterium]|nr:ferrous iron transport protein A [Oscillospiraceae bacterium]